MVAALGADLARRGSSCRTMCETGADMEDKDKETSRGGLAVTFIEC
ncbi:hypothetical protein AB1484_13845 [Parafrankia sp. FMc6]